MSSYHWKIIITVVVTAPSASATATTTATTAATIIHSFTANANHAIFIIHINLIGNSLTYTAYYLYL